MNLKHGHLFSAAQMAEPESVDDLAMNFSFPMPDMNVLNALDDEALEQIIKANYEDVEYGEELYVDPTTFQQELETEATTLLNMAADVNCTETVWNVTLVPRSLRKNHTYVLVRFFGSKSFLYKYLCCADAET